MNRVFLTHHKSDLILSREREVATESLPYLCSNIKEIIKMSLSFVKVVHTKLCLVAYLAVAVACFVS